MLARPGLYAREPDEICIILIFKGRDLHSGIAPSENAQTRETELAQLSPEAQTYWASRPVCRVGIVFYASEMATTRLGRMAIAPITGFGNEGAPAEYKREETSFAVQPLPALGTLTVARNRFCVENAMRQWNDEMSMGLIGRDPREVIKDTWFFNENQKLVQCTATIFHPIHDQDFIEFMQARYLDHYNMNNNYNCLGTRKRTYNMKQAQLPGGLSAEISSTRPRPTFVHGTSLKRNALDTPPEENPRPTKATRTGEEHWESISSGSCTPQTDSTYDEASISPLTLPLPGPLSPTLLDMHDLVTLRIPGSNSPCLLDMDRHDLDTFDLEPTFDFDYPLPERDTSILEDEMRGQSQGRGAVSEGVAQGQSDEDASVGASLLSYNISTEATTLDDEVAEEMDHEDDGRDLDEVDGEVAEEMGHEDDGRDLDEVDGPDEVDVEVAEEIDYEDDGSDLDKVDDEAAISHIISHKDDGVSDFISV